MRSESAEMWDIVFQRRKVEDFVMNGQAEGFSRGRLSGVQNS